MPKKSFTGKGVKQGRSIEEVIVMRKMEATNPLSWPSVDKSVRQPLPQQFPIRDRLMSSSLPIADQSTSITRSMYTADPSVGAGRTFDALAWSERNIDKSQTSKDVKDETIKALVEYCKTLQSRLKDLESNVSTNTSSLAPRNSSHISGGNMNSASQQHPNDTHTMSSTSLSKGHARGIHSRGASAGATGHMSPQRSVKWKDFSTNDQDDSSRSSVRSSYINDGKGYTSDFSNKVSKALTENIEQTVDDLNEKVFHLKHLFNTIDPVNERKWAVIRIQSRIRGFLARCRFCHFNKALKGWKWSRCGSLVRVFETGLKIANKIEVKMRQMAMSRDMRRKFLIFSKWEHVVRQTAPMRRYIREAAEQKGKIKDQQSVRRVFFALYDACIGKMSNKFARRERRYLIEKIRKDLSEQQQDELGSVTDVQGKTPFPGVVSEKAVYRELHRQILQGYREKKKLQISQEAFQAMKYIYDRSKVSLKKALQKRFRTLAGKCFYAWSDWIYMVSVGLDRKRWTGPRKYEVRYNQKVIDVFAKNRLQRMVFFPWKRYASRRSEAERRFRNRLAAFTGNHFTAWRDKAQHLRRLRVATVENWNGYAKLVTAWPFAAWVKFAESAQIRRVQQDRLVKTYNRWKKRQKLSVIMRTWRHQAVYGRVEGMYTRNMLSRSLGEQKLLSTSLQRMLTMQTIELEESRDIVNREIELRKAVEQKLVAKDDEILRYQIVNDHRDQELRRLEAIIEAMAIINPRQVQHLKDMQMEFKFKKRTFDYNALNSANALKVGVLDDDDDDDEASITASSVAGSTRGGSKRNSFASRRDSSARRNSEISKPKRKFTDQSITIGAKNPSGIQDTEDDQSSPSDADDEDDANSMRDQQPQQSSLSEADGGLLIRAKWLVSLYAHGDPQKVSNIIGEVLASNDATMSTAVPDQTKSTATASMASVAPPAALVHASGSPADSKPSTAVGSTLVAAPPASSNASQPTSAAPVQSQSLTFSLGKELPVSEMLLSILAFLEKGDTQCLSAADKKTWTSHILTNMRSNAFKESSSAATTSPGTAVQSKGEDPSWRDVLVNLRSMYPVSQSDRLELGLSNRIIGMRSLLNEVTKTKSARQTRKSKLTLGVPLDEKDEEEDEPPNIYAANIANLVREVNRRMLLEDVDGLHEERVKEEID